ncbi:MAG: glycine zipper family protein [Polyangiales bacterium]
MARFLQVIVSLPTVAFTVLVGVSLLYWLTVVLGALDVEILGGADGADGAADGAHDALGGHDGADGAHDGADGGDGDAGDHDGGVFSALGGVELRKVPVTVRVSFIAIFGWLVSALGAMSLGPAAVRVGVPAAAFNLALAVVALVVGVRLAGFAARPLGPVFAGTSARRKEHLVGQLAEVSTGRVDGRFGQVLVKDGGAGLLLDARHDGEPLKRGDRVVITHYDEERNVVAVEPVDRLTHVRAGPAGAREGEAAEVPAAPAKRKGASDSR